MLLRYNGIVQIAKITLEMNHLVIGVHGAVWCGICRYGGTVYCILLGSILVYWEVNGGV